MGAGGTTAVTPKRTRGSANARCAKRSGNISRDRREVMLGYSTKQ
jgi:hypothetical protein